MGPQHQSVWLETPEFKTWRNCSRAQWAAIWGVRPWPPWCQFPSFAPFPSPQSIRGLQHVYIGNLNNFLGNYYFALISAYSTLCCTLLYITVLRPDLQSHWTFMPKQLLQQRNTEITQGLGGVISHIAPRCCPKKKERVRLFLPCLYPDTERDTCTQNPTYDIHIWPYVTETVYLKGQAF